VTRADRLYRFLGWFLTLCGVAAIAYVFCGCSNLPDPKVAALTLNAEECWRDGDLRIQASLTCPQAVGSLAELVEHHPECAAIFGEKGQVHLSCEGLR
jgi:hypothetical protein